MRKSSVVVLATTNRGKLEEFQSLFAAYPEITLHGAGDYIRNTRGIALAEKYDTYLDNAAAKARLCNHAAHYPALADDSGIEVLSLEGRPGVKSHRYAIAKAGESQDDANVQKLLADLKGSAVRDARLVCTLALVIEGVLLHATGTLDGTIADAPRGELGFGYDPIFIPKGSNRSFAEMTTAEKNQISHRAQALKQLMEQLKHHSVVLAKP